VVLTTYPYLAPKLRKEYRPKGGVEVSLLPLWAFLFCFKVNISFTFTLYYTVILLLYFEMRTQTC
jgi:hypothetical protein